MELMSGCYPESKEVGERKGCACVCARRRVQKSETELETGMAEQGATQWQGSLRQTDEEDGDQERPETTDTGKDGEGAGRWLHG